ncbi:MAG: LuxR family transcriptional regulator [Alphaproteobacteria bacterium]|nr:MAG: LuxR family transcriptional regulator [Alphaproteobacteria bacterium]
MLDGVQNTPALSRREMQCLTQLAMGLSVEEIACRLSISAGTVTKYLNTARMKKKARNRSHLIAIAFREQILP